MKIVIEFPPNINELKANLEVPPGALFTYGDTLYNPTNVYVDTYLMTHEETH